MAIVTKNKWLYDGFRNKKLDNNTMDIAIIVKDNVIDIIIINKWLYGGYCNRKWNDCVMKILGEISRTRSIIVEF